MPTYISYIKKIDIFEKAKLFFKQKTVKNSFFADLLYEEIQCFLNKFQIVLKNS